MYLKIMDVVTALYLRCPRGGPLFQWGTHNKNLKMLQRLLQLTLLSKTFVRLSFWNNIHQNFFFFLKKIKIELQVKFTHTHSHTASLVFLIINCVVSSRWWEDFYTSPHHLSQCCLFLFFVVSFFFSFLFFFSQRTRQCFPPSEWFMTDQWWAARETIREGRGGVCCIYRLWPLPPSREFVLLITSPVVITRTEPPCAPQRSTDSW